MLRHQFDCLSILRLFEKTGSNIQAQAHHGALLRPNRASLGQYSGLGHGFGASLVHQRCDSHCCCSLVGSGSSGGPGRPHQKTEQNRSCEKEAPILLQNAWSIHTGCGPAPAGFLSLPGHPAKSRFTTGCRQGRDTHPLPPRRRAEGSAVFSPLFFVTPIMTASHAFCPGRQCMPDHSAPNRLFAHPKCAKLMNKRHGRSS